MNNNYNDYILKIDNLVDLYCQQDYYNNFEGLINVFYSAAVSRAKKSSIGIVSAFITDYDSDNKICYIRKDGLSMSVYPSYDSKDMTIRCFYGFDGLQENKDMNIASLVECIFGLRALDSYLEDRSNYECFRTSNEYVLNVYKSKPLSSTDYLSSCKFSEFENKFIDFLTNCEYSTFRLFLYKAAVEFAKKSSNATSMVSISSIVDLGKENSYFIGFDGSLATGSNKYELYEYEPGLAMEGLMDIPIEPLIYMSVGESQISSGWAAAIGSDRYLAKLLAKKELEQLDVCVQANGAKTVKML